MTGAAADATARVTADQLRSEVAQVADFSRIRYSQSWEDPACLERALDVQADDSVLSIAAAGDNSFALLLMGDQGPRRVVCVDMSPAQVALVELKRTALLELDHDELLRFLGVTHASAEDRCATYAQLRSTLPARACEIWDAQQQLVGEGVIHTGRLERFFRMYRRYVASVTQSRSAVEGLFEPRTRDEREEYFERVYATRRWRLLLRLFASEFVIGRFGRDPEFFQHVQLKPSEHYYQRVRHAMVELDPSQNWFMQYVLLGRYLDPAAAHPYLRPQNLQLLRERADRLHVHCDELERFLGAQQPRSFSKFNLSDIFEWMSEDLHERMLRALLRTATPGATLAYWNNMVPRSRPQSMAEEIVPDEELARAIHWEDRAFFYRAFRVERVSGGAS